MTVRQRLGVALSSELTVDDWKEVVRVARDQRKISDLARLADQAFGKSQPEEPPAEDDEVGKLTRAERSAIIARLLAEEREQKTPAGDGSDPREA